MAHNDDHDDRIQQAEAFNRAAGEKRSWLFGEFFGFLAQNKKWWLLPILLALLVLGVLVILGGTAAGPFLYSLF